MKTKLRALADYIAKFAGHFACGCAVKPDGSNVQFSKERRRDGSWRWRLRCLEHNRLSAVAARTDSQSHVAIFAN